MEKEYSQKFLQLNRDKNVVFDSKELPFFIVRPDLSDIGRNLRFEQELKEGYPQLTFEEGVTVDGAVVIQDIAVDVMKRGQTLVYKAGGRLEELQKMAERGEIPPLLSPVELQQERIQMNDMLSGLAKELNTTANITLQVVDGFSLSSKIQMLLANIEDNDERQKSISFYPGNGAKIVADYFSRFDPWWSEYYWSEFIRCERKMICKGKFEISTDFSNFDKSIKYWREKDSWIFADPEDIKVVFIIDDVVASGQTMQILAKSIKERCPNAKIVALTWIFVEPTVAENKSSLSGIQGIDETYCIKALRGNYVSRPPIMSLSNFLKDEEKYQRASSEFIEKYINDAGYFQRILELIRKEFIALK